MPLLSRRSLLAATAASFGASFVARGLPALAAPAPATFNHGAFEVTVVSDGHLVLPVSFLAPDAPPAERVDQYHPDPNGNRPHPGRYGLGRPLHAERWQVIEQSQISRHR
jgi:hypothetical protein